MFSKSKKFNIAERFAENKGLYISVLLIMAALNIVIIFSYIGTTNILNENIDATAETTLAKISQDIQDRITECQLYVRIICDSLEGANTASEKKEIVSDYAKRMSTVYSGYYRGIYAEFDGMAYKNGTFFKNDSIKDVHAGAADSAAAEDAAAIHLC